VYDVLKHPRHPYTRRLIDALPKLGRPDQRLMPIEGRPPDPANLPPDVLRAAVPPGAPSARRATCPSSRPATGARSLSVPGGVR